MRKIIIISAILVSLSAATAFAEISIKAEVDKTTTTTDEPITYKLIITSAQKNIPAPQLPSFEGFNVLSQARSSTVSFVESNIKTILVYTYILAPKNKGEFKIGPSTIKEKDKTYSSEEFQIEVTQGKIDVQPNPEEKPPLPKRPQPESEEPQITL